MTRILLLGANGQVGWELRRTLLPLGETIALGRDEADLARPDALATQVRALKPDVILNAAAYTAVDQAEREPELALRVNAESPAVLAREAAACGALYLHYSSDYVFDGSKPSPYTEGDAPNPLNAYGRSKLAGDEAVQHSGADHLILRTSWVYAARGRNFVTTILRLAQEREELRVVSDQIGAPTWARLIAEVTAQILAQVLAERRRGAFTSGLFNLTAVGETSWHGFAEAIVAEARRLRPEMPLALKRIVPIPAAEYPVPARRPANSRLGCESLCRRFGLTLPDWQGSLRLCMEEWVERGS